MKLGKPSRSVLENRTRPEITQTQDDQNSSDPHVIARTTCMTYHVKFVLKNVGCGGNKNKLNMHEHLVKGGGGIAFNG
jgi:hypothetical protein